MFPLCVECNVIPFLHPTAYVCPLHRIHSYIICPYPFPTSGPVLPLPFDINCAGGCPSPSSASDRAANSTLSWSPAEHVMKWPNSGSSPQEGVGNHSAACHDVSCDSGRPGGDPHLSPRAAPESRAHALASGGLGHCASCWRGQDSPGTPHGAGL